MKTINLDEILNKDTFQFLEKPGLGKRKLYVKAAMKEAVRQALEIAAEEATVSLPSHLHLDGTKNVSRQSILNVIERVE